MNKAKETNQENSTTSSRKTSGEVHAISATQMIRDDHKRIRGLLRQLEAIDLRSHEMKAGVLKQLFMELEIHNKIKDQVFYPSLEMAIQTERGSAQEVGVNLLERLRLQREDINTLVTDLRGIQSSDLGSDAFVSKFTQLEDALEQQFDDEENDVLPLAQQRLANDLEDLGGSMHERRTELLALPGYVDALPENTQDPKGGEQMRKRPAA